MEVNQVSRLYHTVYALIILLIDHIARNIKRFEYISAFEKLL